MLSHTRSGSGPPIVLIHGTGSCKEVWDPVVPALARSHEVFAVDLPGFGESAPLRRTHTVDALTDALVVWLRELGLDRPTVAGNSLGGWIALELAVRNIVRSVVALSPSGLFTSREAAYVRRVVLAHQALAKALAPGAQVASRLPGAWVVSSVMLARPWRVDRDASVLQARRLAQARGLREAIDDQAGRQPRGLAGIGVPVTIAWGTRDRLLFPRQAARFSNVIPGAELTWLPGAGHMPMSDDPEAVAAVIAGQAAG